MAVTGHPFGTGIKCHMWCTADQSLYAAAHGHGKLSAVPATRRQRVKVHTILWLSKSKSGNHMGMGTDGLISKY